jgi:hypothetical protein
MEEHGINKSERYAGYRILEEISIIKVYID